MEAYYKENRECTNSADFYDKLMQLKAEQEEHIRLVEAVYLRELTGNSPVLSGPQASTPRRKRSGSKPRKGILKSSSTEDKDKVPPSSRPSPRTPTPRAPWWPQAHPGAASPLHRGANYRDRWGDYIRPAAHCSCRPM